MILITQNDFTERTGVDLSADTREDGLTNDRQATALITRWEKYVYQVASKMGFPIVDDKLNEAQIEDVKDAVCNYGLSCVLNGDLQALGGELFVNATRDIIAVLRQHGLIQNGFKGRSGCIGRWV